MMALTMTSSPDSSACSRSSRASRKLMALCGSEVPGAPNRSRRRDATRDATLLHVGFESFELPLRFEVGAGEFLTLAGVGELVVGPDVFGLLAERGLDGFGLLALREGCGTGRKTCVFPMLLRPLWRR